MFRVFRLRKDERGQAMIEFALIGLMLITLIFGVLEFGWLLNAQITLNSAAREGARVGAVMTKDQQIKVDEAVQETANLSGLTILSSPLTDADDDLAGKRTVVVTVNASMEPLVGFFLKEDVSMQAVATMRRE